MKNAACNDAKGVVALLQKVMAGKALECLFLCKGSDHLQSVQWCSLVRVHVAAT